MELLIDQNLMRLTNRQFMVLVPEKLGVLKPGSKVNIRTDQYGQMGVAEVSSVFPCPLFDIKVMMSLMTDGDISAKDRLKQQYNIYNADTIYCAALRFIRRYNAAFENMIAAETKKAGLSLSIHQAKLAF